MEIIDIKQETEKLKKSFSDYLDMIAELVNPDAREDNPVLERNIVESYRFESNGNGGHDKISLLEKGREVLNSQNDYISTYSIIWKTDSISYIEGVNRLSDGIIFNINEVVSTNNGRGKHRIRDFKVIENKMCVDLEDFPTQYEFLDKIEKLNKEVLLITEDGVDVYLKDTVYYVSKKSLQIGVYFVFDSNCIQYGHHQDYIYFSTKEKSEEYLLMNKPILSLNDLLSVHSFNNAMGSDYNERTDLFNKIKALATYKLNNK